MLESTMSSNNIYDEKDRKSYVKVGRIHAALKHFMHEIYIENLLKTDGDINYRILVGSTKEPDLLYASLHHEHELFKLLLEYGADFIYKNEEGKTIVHRLIERYPEEIYMNSVLEAHVKFNNPSNPADENGITHFHVACRNDNVAAVKFFLINGVDINHATNENSKNFSGYTPLHFAVEYGSPNVAEILLNNGADVHLKNGAGLSPLQACVEKKIVFKQSPNAYDEILKVFAYFVNDHKPDHVEDVDDYGFCILHAICLQEDESIVEKIIEKTKNVNRAVNLDSPIRPGYTALHFAAFSSIKIFQLLLDNGADITATNSEGETPLDICLRYKSAQDIYFIIMIIPECRNIVMSDNKTKLASIVFDMRHENEPFSFPNHETTDFTIFVPFDSPLWPGYTILHLAVIFTKGELGIAKIKDCLERGADRTAKNAKGMTALELAENMEKFDTVECLQFYLTDRPRVLNDRRNKLSDLDELHDYIEIFPHIDDDLLLLEENLKNGMSNSQDEHFLNRLADILQYLTSEGDISTLFRKRPLLKFHSTASIAFKQLKLIKGNPTNKDGISVFHLACLTGNADSVKKFLEYGVDVNQTISYFSDYSPGRTALHLVLKNHDREKHLASETYSRGKKLSSSSAIGNQIFSRMVSAFSNRTFLRIVDVLLENGANVNAVDAFGETPLFHAIRLPAPLRQIVIDKLISYGANIHMTSVKGNTPFSLSLYFRYSWEEIEVFLKAGCSFDSYNPITQEGYMSIVFRSYSTTNEIPFLKNRVCREIISDPKIIEDNCLGRTAIHNVVSIGLVESENRRYYQRDSEEDVDESVLYRAWTELIELLVERGCDIDQQDNEGKTALHLAVLHNNILGVHGLLKNGADINSTDNNEQTVFAHNYSSPGSSDDGVLDRQYSHTRLILAMHVYKLNFCGEHVSEQYEILQIEEDRFENDAFDHFHEEIKKTTSMKIGKTFELSVYEFLMRNDMDIVYANTTQAERIEIDQFFKDLGKYKFEEIDCVLKFKYRRIIERVKLIEQALESFNVLIKYQLPDLCCRYIMKFLRNKDLKQLIASTS